MLKTTTNLPDTILDLVGNTPLVRADGLLKGAEFNLFVKLEGFNPGGSMKDRPALNMIKHAFDAGLITKRTTIIESSSGNMGIGLAQACLKYGLKFICVTDSRTNLANIRIMQAFGTRVEVVDTPTKNGSLLDARLERLHNLLSTIPDSYWPNQYANEFNAHAHEQTMREIAESLDGKVDFLFAATGSCGTIRGCSDYIKKNGMATKVCAVDAEGSVIFGGKPRARLIPGHGAARCPALFSPDMADEVIYVNDKECVVGCQLLVKHLAILAGGSSGAVVMAARKSMDKIPKGSNVVVVLGDRGERYLDTIYNESWVEENIGTVKGHEEEA